MIILGKLILFGLFMFTIDKWIPMYDVIRWVFRLIVIVVAIGFLAALFGFPLPPMFNLAAKLGLL